MVFFVIKKNSWWTNSSGMCLWICLKHFSLFSTMKNGLAEKNSTTIKKSSVHRSYWDTCACVNIFKFIENVWKIHTITILVMMMMNSVWMPDVLFTFFTGFVKGIDTIHSLKARATAHTHTYPPTNPWIALKFSNNHRNKACFTFYCYSSPNEFQLSWNRLRTMNITYYWITFKRDWTE